MQQDLAQYYAAKNPGQVQVLGVDLWNGTASQLANFRAVTGATFPLLQSGGSATGGNVELLYGTYDNYIVLNKQRIVRYHAALAWPHGNRYHVDEIRACVDSLVASTLDAPPAVPSAAPLTAAPNPVGDGTRIALTLAAPAGDAEIVVLDVSGRRLATLHRGPLPAGASAWSWQARDASGARVAPGVYLVRARIGRASRLLRLAVVR